MDNRKFGSLSSSVDPQSLSATVSGGILSFSAVIIFLASHFGFNLGNEQISMFAQQVGLAVGSLWFLFGLVRKLVVSIQQRYSNYSK